MNLMHTHFTKIVIEGVDYEATDGVFDIRPSHVGRACELGLTRVVVPEAPPEPDPDPIPEPRHERPRKGL